MHGRASADDVKDGGTIGQLTLGVAGVHRGTTCHPPDRIDPMTSGSIFKRGETI
jgi:hypothetical protein